MLMNPVYNSDIELVLILVRHVNHVEAEMTSVSMRQNNQENGICMYGGRLCMLTSCCTKERDAVIIA